MLDSEQRPLPTFVVWIAQIFWLMKACIAEGLVDELPGGSQFVRDRCDR